MAGRNRSRRPADRIPGPAASPTVAVRVKPGSARAGIGGRADGPYGPALVIAVHPPAVEGRATEAARRALAAALGVRPAAVALRAGGSSRNKLFTVDAPAAVLDARVRRLRDGAPAGSVGAGSVGAGSVGAGSVGAGSVGASSGGAGRGGAKPAGAERGAGRRPPAAGTEQGDLRR